MIDILSKIIIHSYYNLYSFSCSTAKHNYILTPFVSLIRAATVV